jgi:hypothetical protein
VTAKPIRFPRIRVRSAAGEERTVARQEWVRLERPTRDFDANPPQRDGDSFNTTIVGSQGASSPFGAGRLGRRRWSVSDGWAHPGPWPPWQDGDELADLDRDRRGFSMVVPRDWRAEDFAAAYARAWRIIRQCGLRHAAHTAWVYRAQGGAWWAWHQLTGEDVVGLAPRCFSMALGRADLQSRARGGRPGGPDPSQLPAEFLGDFGGVDGALHWAFQVASIGRTRLAAVRDQRRRLPLYRALTAHPRWLALRKALERGWPRGGGLREALGIVERDLRQGPVATELAAYALGFEAGATLARLQSAKLIADAEAHRTPGKAEMRKLLDEIVLDEAKRGEIQPYRLADALLSEADTTERGRRLMALGVPGRNRLGVWISKAAERLGLRVPFRPAKRKASSP